MASPAARPKVPCAVTAVLRRPTAEAYQCLIWTSTVTRPVHTCASLLSILEGLLAVHYHMPRGKYYFCKAH